MVAKCDGGRWRDVRDVNEPVSVVFSGLSALVIEGVTDEGEVIRVSARTRDDPVPCPVCERLVGPVLGCPRQTFREQVPGVVERY